MTLDAKGNPSYTKVVENPYILGQFEFIEIMLAKTARVLSVSESHPMVLSNGSKLAAKDVKASDIVLAHPGGLTEVTRVGKSTRLGKWALMTDTCSVLANGIFTGTLCDDAAKFQGVMAPSTLKDIDDLFQPMDANGDGS